MVSVFLEGVGVDEDVVQVAYHEHVAHIMEDVIHEVLECGRGVGHAKRHHKGNANIVVPRAEVELGVDFGASEPVDKISNEGKGVPVLLCDFIEAPVIDTEAERAVLLLDKQYWGSGSKDQGPDESLAKYFIEMILKST
ncbi:hypothetical protein C0992_004474 [Termitomyces sp. T32_za158]|nr:hypothetical protein C0992_004474 [Termitomyces sp. T32_za158]